MNIFYLHKNHYLSATFHCDKHVVKMILEYAQMMSTAHHLCSSSPSAILYKKTHENHPSSIWARSGVRQYRWLYNCWLALCLEYKKRYGKQHQTFLKLKGVLSITPENLVDSGWSDPPQCMDDQYKDADTVYAYRKFYIGAKKSFAKWKNGRIPEWFHE